MDQPAKDKFEALDNKEFSGISGIDWEKTHTNREQQPMLLLSNNKFNNSLFTGAWTRTAASKNTKLLVTVSGYPTGDKSKEAGFPLKEMSQVLFPNQTELVSAVERIRFGGDGVL